MQRCTKIVCASRELHDPGHLRCVRGQALGGMRSLTQLSLSGVDDANRHSFTETQVAQASQGPTTNRRLTGARAQLLDRMMADLAVLNLALRRSECRRLRRCPLCGI